MASSFWRNLYIQWFAAKLKFKYYSFFSRTAPLPAWVSCRGCRWCRWWPRPPPRPPVSSPAAVNMYSIMRFVKLFSHQSTSLQHLTKEKKKVLHEVSISQTILRESWALRDWRDPHPRSRTREIETSKQTILHRPSDSRSQVNLRWGYAAHNKLITNIPWNCSTVCINTVVEFLWMGVKISSKNKCVFLM